MPVQVEVLFRLPRSRVPRFLQNANWVQNVGDFVGPEIFKVAKNARKTRAQTRQLQNLKKILSVRCVLVSGPEMRKLNREFRGQDKVTDILSFESGEPEVLGELVFCLPVLKAQARAHRLSLQEEFLYLFIHGLLHLLAWDHERSQSEAASMFRIQDLVFEKGAFFVKTGLSRKPGSGHPKGDGGERA